MTTLKLPERVLVGSYFLETLTTGMYENPLHCLREYVQNSFDAILDARRTGILEDDVGSVDLTISKSKGRRNLIIKDDGVGIGSTDAVATLMALGGSSKKPVNHAGFRGIGRLAGIAYCQTLRFTTTVKGATTAAVIEFDCGLLRGNMQPGSKPRDISLVLKEATKLDSITAAEADHFMKVEMEALTDVGEALIEEPELSEYLRQHCPVPYDPKFSYVDQIRAAATSYSISIPTINLTVHDARTVTNIYKPFRNSVATDADKLSKSYKLKNIETFGNKTSGWFGWIGINDFRGEIKDESLAAIRFRLKNIQIGGADIADRILGDTSAKSNRRFNRWMMGEIFVDGSLLVPNARRDGFEDGKDWSDIRGEIQKHLELFAKRIRKVSGNRNAIIKIGKELEKTDDKVSDLVKGASGAEKKAIDAELSSQIESLQKKLDTGAADPKEVSTLTSKLKEVRERLENVPLVPASDRRLKLDEALAAVRETLLERLEQEDAKDIVGEIEKKLHSLAQ